VRKYYWAIYAIVVFVGNASAPAFASEMVYHPVIPAFGGNPLNGSALLSTAQAQGEGVKSGSQGPDLSGLNNALNNLGAGGGGIFIGGSGSGGSGNGGSSGGSGSSSNSVRATVP
jgi:curli production assembly/transport component CsgF